MKLRFAWVPAFVLAVALAASAAPLTGRVTNGTTKKAQGGDDVVLLALSQGMQEAARTKAAGDGSFKFEMPDDGGPHLVRVNHQGVNYFAMVPPGRSSADVTVYDAAAKVEGISGTVDLMRFQSDGSTLQVTELFAVRNNSNPPRSQMSDQAFEFYLPEGAQVDSAMAQGPGGQPITTNPVPQKEKNRYAFIFPLRPGETRFQLSYHLPYSGQAAITPRPLIPYEHVVIMAPSSMKFEAATGAQFQSMPPENGADVRVSSTVKPGDKLAFTISGTGQIQESTEEAAQGGGGRGGQMAQRGRPGGGLGAPEETPDPLHQYRWWILGGLTVVMGVGAFWVMSRQPASVAGPAVPVPRPVAQTTRERGEAPSSSGNGNRILEALKEELFQLELDKHQGRITAEEYEKARAALDVTIQRAAARQRS